MDPVHTLGLRTIVTSLAAGDLTSEVLVRGLFRHSDAVDKDLRGYLWRREEDALAEARAADRRRREGKTKGVMDGVPISLKDNFDLQGSPSTLGMGHRRSHQAESDALLVSSLRDAGAIFLGKSNVPQTLMAMETTNQIGGTSSNPWDRRRTPGGSSGGEAVLVASGQSPLGLASDIGGSVRMPAAYCGLVGFKPTLHRYSTLGMRGALPGQEFVRAVPGPLGRDCDDVTFFLEQLATLQSAELDTELAPVPWENPRDTSVQGMRVGYYLSDGDLQPSSSVQRAVMKAKETLEAAGVEVIPYEPAEPELHYALYVAGVTADGIRTAFNLIQGEPLISSVRSNVRLARLPKAVRWALAKAMDARGENRSARALQHLGEKSVAEYWALCHQRRELRHAEMKRWRALGIHALLCPATATPAPQHGKTADFTAAAVYTARYNLIDLPAGVVPVTLVRDEDLPRTDPRDRIERRAQEIETESTGLPIGVQLVSRPWDEAKLLSLMRTIETERKKAPDFPQTPVV